jgi:predicted membrane protein
LYATNVKDAKLISEKFSHDVLIGKMLSIFLLAVFNVLAYKSKQLYWLIVPLGFFAFTQLVNAYNGEILFRYKKAVNLWEGGFSVAPIFTIIVIAMAAIVIFINYHILGRLIKKANS